MKSMILTYTHPGSVIVSLISRISDLLTIERRRKPKGSRRVTETSKRSKAPGA